MRLYVRDSRTGTTVVRTLRAGETPLGPTVRGVVRVEKSVLLFETKPRNVFFSEFHGLLSMVAEVGPVGRAVAVVGRGEDEDVVSAAEGIFEDGGGPKVDVGIVARRLVRRRAVEVPDAQVTQVFDLLRHGLQRRCGRALTRA